MLDFWSPRVRRMERKRDVAGIIDVLRSGSARARRAAANTLIRVPDARSAGPLAEALSSTDPLLRRNAAIALGEIGRALPPEQAAAIDTALIGALSDADASVRTMAAAALGRTRPPAASAPLTGLLDDPVPSVRTIATLVLHRYDAPAPTDAPSP